MRHFRMPGTSNIKNIHSFEKQVELILQQIDKFNEKDKNAAYSYIKRRITRSSKSKKTKHKRETKLKKLRHKSNFSRKKIEGFVPPRHKKALHNVHVKPLVLRCKICSVAKRTKLNFLQHLKTHQGSPISCAKCKKSFNNRIAYDFHLAHICGKKVKNTNETYKCKECSMEFDFKRHYMQHVEGHQRNNCPYCDVVLTKRIDLIKHMYSAHSIKLETARYKCDYCEKRYVKQRSLFYHLRTHSGDKHVCMECGHMCATIEEFLNHEEDHKNQKPYQCSKCDDRFMRKQQFQVHLQRHDTYKCVTCDESYASKQRAIRHKQRGHVVEGLHPRMQCPYCDKAFHRSYYLQTHMRTHSDTTKATISCKYCDKTFKSPYQYVKHCTTTRHAKKSPGQLQLFCNICGKSFRKKHNLEDHLYKVHNKAKELMNCEFCEYKTNNRTNLERHRNLHLNVGNVYICDQCGKEFPNMPGLKGHISYIHQQTDRPFKCNECGKAFKRNAELIRHSKIHSNECPYVCQQCNSAFKRNSHLKRHEVLVHKTTPNVRKVQRLQADSNGLLIPLESNKKSNSKQKAPLIQPPVEVTLGQQTENSFVEVVNVQQLEYFSLPVNSMNEMVLPKSMNSNIINLDPTDYNQQMYWDKVNEQKTEELYAAENNMLTEMALPAQGSDFQAFNIVDQLVNSFLPDKNLQLNQNSLYDEYANQALQYTNLGLPNVSNDLREEILTTTERILQGQCDSSVILDSQLTEYMQPYQYMQ